MTDWPAKAEAMKVALDTLGCKLNQAETELLARQLAEAGYEVVPQVDGADVYILNTCTVTHTADAKSRHRLRLAHHRNPGVLVIATGCYAQREPEKLSRIEGVNLVISHVEKSELPRLLEKAGCRPTAADLTGNSSPSLRTRTFVKIQDGCNSYCAYCIVPLVRGREKSLPATQVAAEVEQRVADGYKEVVLTGTKVGSYQDNGASLKELLERILAQTDIPRLRLSSLQPQEISPELIGLWRNERLCPHFHLSLQSGADPVLRRMKRRYSVSEYQKAVSLMRHLLPDAAITTDVIVGFPGETTEEFQESYEICRDLEFARIHVFPYSPRPGTAAAQSPGKVSEKVKRERSQQMLALARESARNFKQRFIGQTRPVLWERQDSKGIWSGLTDNYIKVYTKSSDDLTNKLLPVKLVEVRGMGYGGININPHEL
jgi:threonylcarbamoyladenosine tRNA methylthiotransferase MtaB